MQVIYSGDKDRSFALKNERHLAKNLFIKDQ